MRILITGVGGFVGGHLLRHIVEAMPAAEIHGSVLETESHLPDRIAAHTGIDLKEPHAVRALIADIQPQCIYHLAAQASPAKSREAGGAWETLETNIKAQLSVFEACLSLGLAPRILVIASGEIYGKVGPDDAPIQENTPLRPRNPYAVSKAAQDLLGLQYYLSNRLPIIRARPFNHIGPGQRLGFVAPDYAHRIAAIEIGQMEPALTVRNPSDQRDFTDVRDMVRAYRLLMEKGAPGEVYNVASGNVYSVQALVSVLLSHATTPIRVQYDETEGDQARITSTAQVDTTRLRSATGWQPNVPFEQTLLDVLKDWRQRIQVSTQP